MVSPFKAGLYKSALIGALLLYCAQVAAIKKAAIKNIIFLLQLFLLRRSLTNLASIDRHNRKSRNKKIMFFTAALSRLLRHSSIAAPQLQSLTNLALIDRRNRKSRNKLNLKNIFYCAFSIVAATAAGRRLPKHGRKHR